jgi:hypothetical protein
MSLLIELGRVIEYQAMLENLTATQARCTELIQENRALKRDLDAATTAVPSNPGKGTHGDTGLVETKERLDQFIVWFIEYAKTSFCLSDTGLRDLITRICEEKIRVGL